MGLDAFAEAYHVNTIHAGSFPGTFSTGLQMINRYEPANIPEPAPHNELYDYSNTVPNSFDAHRFVAAHGEIEDR